METTRFTRRILRSLLLITTFFFFADPASATHFRYGHYSWRPAGGTTVEITLQNAFRRNGYDCIDPTTLGIKACSPGDGLPQVEDVIEESIGGTRLEWGDGTSVGSPGGGPLLYVVRAIDPANNSLFGFALDPDRLPALDTTLSHTYAATGNFTAFTYSCCRISASQGVNEHINNPDDFYRVETVINVGTANDSPISALPPIVRCPIDALCSFQVPVTDPDNDPVRFRLSTSAEASGFFGAFIQPGPPHAPNVATIDSTTGIYTWDTTGATRAANSANNTLYSTQVTLEDPTSKAALDFFIQLAPLDPTPPVITPPAGSPPVCERTELFSVGNTKTFDVLASDPDAGDTVTLNVAALPVGAVMTPSLPVTGNPLSSTFSWAPQPEQTGRHVVNFTASSSAGGFALCPVFVRAGTVPPAGEIVPARGRNVCRRSGCNLLFTCNFSDDLGPCTQRINVLVRRPPRRSDEVSARAPRRIRFAAGVANIPPGQTMPVRFTLTRAGKRIVRSGVRRIQGRLQIQNLARSGVTNTPPITIRIRRR